MRIAWGGRMLAAAAVLIVVIIGAWTYREFGIMQRRIEQLERERSALRSQLALAIRSTATTPIFSIILSGGERGSGQASTLMLPRSPAIVNVWLLLPPHARAATYTATLQSVDGRTLWTVGGLTPRSVDERQTVVASIPSSILAQGTFVISLSAGGQTIEDYSFSVRQ